MSVRNELQRNAGHGQFQHCKGGEQPQQQSPAAFVARMAAVRGPALTM